MAEAPSPHWSLFTLRAREVVERSLVEALRLNAPFITNTHLLLGVLFEDGKISVPRRILQRLGVKPEQIYADVEAVAASEVFEVQMQSNTVHELSEAAVRTLEYAHEEAIGMDNRFIGAEHIFLGLLSDESSVVSRVLIQNGVDRQQFLDEVLKLQDPRNI